MSSDAKKALEDSEKSNKEDPSELKQASDDNSEVNSEEKKQETIADNEKFIWLMRVACEDREVEDNLMNILALPPEARQQMLNTLSNFLTQQGDSPEMIAAIEYLKHNHVAEQAWSFIDENSYHRKRARKKAEKLAKKEEKKKSKDKSKDKEKKKD